MQSRALLFLAALFMVVGGWVDDANAAGQRVALVVGNAGYRFVAPLANPANDARLIAATLGELGFSLVGGGPLVDADRSRLEAAIEAFGRSLAGADVAVFYYAGHGFQVQGTNWLVPVGANPTRPQDLDFHMVDAALVLRQMEGAGTGLNVVILDACRNNPFAGRGLRGLEAGLAQMHAPEGTLIAYATQPGSVAQDGSGANSPYAIALAESIRKPGLDVLRMFNRVALAVKRSTGGSQLPWLSSSPIEGEFAFAAPPAPVAARPEIAAVEVALASVVPSTPVAARPASAPIEVAPVAAAPPALVAARPAVAPVEVAPAAVPPTLAIPLVVETMNGAGPAKLNTPRPEQPPARPPPETATAMHSPGPAPARASPCTIDGGGILSGSVNSSVQMRMSNRGGACEVHYWRVYPSYWAFVAGEQSARGGATERALVAGYGSARVGYARADLADAAAHGTVVIERATDMVRVRYRPATGFTGTDRFAVRLQGTNTNTLHRVEVTVDR